MILSAVLATVIVGDDLLVFEESDSMPIDKLFVRSTLLLLDLLLLGRAAQFEVSSALVVLITQSTMSEETNRVAPDTAVVDLAESEPELEKADGRVDKYGIPLTIKHAPQNHFTPVWQFIHRLTMPYPSSQHANWPYTHICVVCAEKFKTEDPTANSWLKCLMRQKISSNARLHMLRQHEEHSYSVEAKQKAIAQKLGKIQAHDAENRPQPNGTKIKKQRTLAETLIVKDDEMRIMATRWLLSSGLPHTTVQNPELLNMVRRLSNQPHLTFPARQTFYEFAEADFQSFASLTTAYLQEELSKTRGCPFVAMMHDLCTNGSNVNVTGVTIQFVNSQWRLMQLSLLATPNSLGHAAPIVATSIKDQIWNRYSLLSLWLLYALGLKENTRQGGAVVVTSGGRFDEGKRVIQNLRDLASFFSTPAREKTLSQLKDLFNLPPVNIAIDGKTRVGYAATLLRRSVYNFFAFSKYFERAPASEQATWLELSADDWNLIVEMEAITNQLAQFSLGEVQKETASSSYALLFRKLLKMTFGYEGVPMFGVREARHIEH